MLHQNGRCSRRTASIYCSEWRLKADWLSASTFHYITCVSIKHKWCIKITTPSAIKHIFDFLIKIIFPKTFFPGLKILFSNCITARRQTNVICSCGSRDIDSTTPYWVGFKQGLTFTQLPLNVFQHYNSSPTISQTGKSHISQALH